MRKPRASWKWSVIAGTGLALGVSCSDPTPEGPPPDAQLEQRQALLQSVAQCTQSRSEAFVTEATALEAAVSAWKATPSVVTREAAREAFREAMASWQELELFGFGPAASGALPGGEDVRDNIYSWPLVNRCAVEESLVARADESSDFGSSLVNRRGLAALEYLLFYEGQDSACSPSSSIIAGGGWNALGDEGRAERKRAYALAVASDVKERAASLAADWRDEEGAFRRTFTGAGESGNEVYASPQAALNAVSDALLYIDSELKDMKLAMPLGLIECESETCPEHLESRFARLSKENVRANLVGFRRLMEGCEADFSGNGFDDLLGAVNAASVAESLRARAMAAQAALDVIEEADLREALSQDLASVQNLHAKVKDVTDLLKTEFLSVLDLELPKSLEGDND